MINKDTFSVWLEQQDSFELPLCTWGPSQTEIAVKFANDMAARQMRRTLDEALNSGDGSYRP